MYEFTHRGLWFDWQALDRPSRRLAAGSLMAAALAALPIGAAAGDLGYRIGYRLGSGRPDALGDGVAFAPWMAAWVIGFGTISAVLWWLFSRRQDEMFNRVQKWALGMAGGWTMTIATVWALLNAANAAPPIDPVLLIGAFYAALIGFWMVAVRRWV